MKKAINIFMVLALVSLVAGIISRATLTPLSFGLEANALLRFTDTCLFFAIALSLVGMQKK